MAYLTHCLVRLSVLEFNLQIFMSAIKTCRAIHTMRIWFLIVYVRANIIFHNAQVLQYCVPTYIVHVGYIIVHIS